jgi:hypothetical protein
LSAAFILLTEEALKPNGGIATWGRDGYYFAESGEHTWSAIASGIATLAAARGISVSPEVEQLTPEEATKVHPWATYIWGGNCRSRADRLRSMGWKATAPSLVESLPEIVDIEIKAFKARLA